MKGQIAKSTVSTSLVLFLRLSVQAGTLLLIARIFGPDAFGAFVGIAALATVIGVLSTFGGHILVLAEMSRAPEAPSRALPMAVATSLFLAPVLALVFVIVSHSLFPRAVSLTALLLIALSEIVLRPFLSLISVQHQARGAIARSQWLTTLPLVLRLIAALVVYASPGNDPVAAFAAGMCLSMAIATVSGSLGGNARLPFMDARRLSRRYLREAFGYGFMATATTAPSEVDKTLATQLLSPFTSGLYAISARALGALTLPVSALMVSAMPRLFRESAAGDEGFVHLHRKIFASVLLYGVAVAVAMWLAAPAIEWALGPRYAGASAALQWLALAAPGVTLRVAAGQTLMSLEQPWRRTWIELTGLASLIVAALLFVPGHSLPAMIMCVVVVELAMAAVAWRTIFRYRRDRSGPVRSAGP